MGPNALAYLEASLAAISSAASFVDVDSAMQAVAIVHAYMIGAIRVESGERRPRERAA